LEIRLDSYLGSLNNVMQWLLKSLQSLIYSITLLSKMKYGATVNEAMLHLI